ncbi:MAG: hypothetical protein FWC73_12145 [Defluviitaleaceae bacterium]|nr:hypothetical protein [Defluviitaleaceae bacterium]
MLRKRHLRRPAFLPVHAAKNVTLAFLVDFARAVAVHDFESRSLYKE